MHAERDIVLANLSVCPSNSFHFWYRHDSIVFFERYRCYNILKGGKFLRFSTEIAVYLGNGRRYANGSYGSLLGSHMQPIDLCGFL